MDLACRHIEAIILAGGVGSRFGDGKLLAPYRGAPLIAGALRAALTAPVRRVILVTGHDGDRVRDAALALAADEPVHVPLDVVHSDRYREGMALTLGTGLGALSQEADGAFVFLGDMPRIPVGVAAQLAGAIGQRSAAAPTFGGVRGHPVLFRARMFPLLLRLTGDRGARAILDGLGEDLALVASDNDGILFDVDHPDFAA
jgi:molybdenum cofactor cytidylyltransferase